VLVFGRVMLLRRLVGRKARAMGLEAKVGGCVAGGLPLRVALAGAGSCCTTARRRPRDTLSLRTSAAGDDSWQQSAFSHSFVEGSSQPRALAQSWGFLNGALPAFSQRLRGVVQVLLGSAMDGAGLERRCRESAELGSFEGLASGSSLTDGSFAGEGCESGGGVALMGWAAHDPV